MSDAAVSGLAAAKLSSQSLGGGGRAATAMTQARDMAREGLPHESPSRLEVTMWARGQNDWLTSFPGAQTQWETTDSVVPWVLQVYCQGADVDFKLGLQMHSFSWLPSHSHLCSLSFQRPSKAARSPGTGGADPEAVSKPQGRHPLAPPQNSRQLQEMPPGQGPLSLGVFPTPPGLGSSLRICQKPVWS